MDVIPEVIVDEGQPAEVVKANPITDIKPEVVEPTEEATPPPVEKPAEEPIPKGVQKRIDRAVRQKYEAEARAKMLEERVNAMEARQFQAPQRQNDDQEPTIDKFDNFDQYVAAKAEYIAKKQIESTLSAREKQQREAHEATERTKTVESWNKRVAAATAEMPDFEEVLAASEDIPMTPAMQQVIMESDVGTKLAYYLATNPDEASKIANMHPVAAIRSLGRIEERLATAKPVVQTTSAPPPIKPIGASATVKKDPGKMSDAEYEKWRRSGRAA